MIGIIHPLAGAVAILTIATFWLSTALSELFCSQTTIIAVKTAIPWGFLLLVPAIALAAGQAWLWPRDVAAASSAARLDACRWWP